MLAVLAYPRASAPAQSLLFAGVERYRLLEWLFFRYARPRISAPPALRRVPRRGFWGS